MAVRLNYRVDTLGKCIAYNVMARWDRGGKNTITEIIILAGYYSRVPLKRDTNSTILHTAPRSQQSEWKTWIKLWTHEWHHLYSHHRRAIVKIWETICSHYNDIVMYLGQPCEAWCCKHRLFLICMNNIHFVPPWIRNCMQYRVWIGLVISSHTLLCIWLPIRAILNNGMPGTMDCVTTVGLR